MNKSIIVASLILGLAILGAAFVYKTEFNEKADFNKNVTKIAEDEGFCSRTTPYETPPELSRAMDLVREKVIGSPNAPKPVKGDYKNCIHLIYKSHAEMEGAEGYFTFDNTSAANDIRIYVDDTYKNYDDLLTASLLAHEIRHATFYVRTLSGEEAPSCVDNETAAFYSQLIFLTNLNEEEWKSVTLRVGQNPNLNSAYAITDHLLLLNVSANQACPNDVDQSCWNNYVLENLKRWVASNPFYQKQCDL